MHALKHPPEGLKEIFAQHALGASLRGRHAAAAAQKQLPKAKRSSILCQEDCVRKHGCCSAVMVHAVRCTLRQGADDSHDKFACCRRR